MNNQKKGDTVASIKFQEELDREVRKTIVMIKTSIQSSHLEHQNKNYEGPCDAERIDRFNSLKHDNFYIFKV